MRFLAAVQRTRLLLAEQGRVGDVRDRDGLRVVDRQRQLLARHLQRQNACKLSGVGRRGRGQTDPCC